MDSFTHTRGLRVTLFDFPWFSFGLSWGAQYNSQLWAALAWTGGGGLSPKSLRIGVKRNTRTFLKHFQRSVNLLPYSVSTIKIHTHIGNQVFPSTFKM